MSFREVIGDWGDLDPTAVDVAMQAAKRVHGRFKDHAELEELEGEALALLLQGADHQRAIASESYGFLQHQLERDLWNVMDKVVRRHGKDVSYDALRESEDGSESPAGAPHVVMETVSDDYAREAVEMLLPAVWDDSYAWGMPERDDAPDPDMPKGSTNKARANNLAAYLADIRTGWAKAPLTDKERRALVLAYGFGDTHEAIGVTEGCSRPVVSARVHTAIGKIVARLNGGYYYDSEQEAA